MNLDLIYQTEYYYIAIREKSRMAFLIPKNTKGVLRMIRYFEAFAGLGAFRSAFEKEYWGRHYDRCDKTNL